MADYTWITPVTDRTPEDVAEAVRTKKAALLDPNGTTYAESKGCLNASDLNRITNNMLWIEQEMTALGYGFPPLPALNMWSLADYSTQNATWSRIADLFAHLGAIVALMPYSIMPYPVPPNMLYWDHINNIESIQLAVYVTINLTIADLRYAGTFEADSWWNQEVN
jgi:hypothetical protein